MLYKTYIESLKAKWVGKKVRYAGHVYTICDVDYNGLLHIDRPSLNNPTTAVFTPYQAEQALVKEK